MAEIPYPTRDSPLPARSLRLPDRRVSFGILLLLAIGSVTLAPVAYVIVASFDVSSTGAPFKFGLDGWRDVFTERNSLSSIYYSFLLAVRVPIAIVAAFVIAWLLIRVQIPGRRFIELSLWFGFFLPVLPMVMGWILLLDAHYGLINTLLEKLPFVDGAVFSIYSVPGLIWVHLSLTTVPIMVILLTPAFRQLDAAYEEAADISGAGIGGTLRRVTIPLLVPAIVTAFVAGLIKSLETFEVEQILGTPVKIYVYATRIYDLINLEPPLFAAAMALSSLFLVVLLGLAVAYHRYLGRTGDIATITGKSVRLKPRTTSGRWVYAVSAILILYVAVSIFLPLLILILGSCTRLFGYFFMPHPWTLTHWLEVFGDDRFIEAALNSVLLGTAVGLIGVLLFSLVAWALVRADIWGRRLISVVVWLPWAIPGLVLGVTLLSLMLNVPGISWLYGTVIPLVLALIVKELPIGVQLLRNSLGQVSGELEEAARVAGAGFVAIFRRVTLPLVVPMLISVFLLIFAGTIRDISTVVLIAAPGLRTLSLLMFDFAIAGRFESASVVGVLIAVISLLITILAFRIGNRVGVGNQ
jgi:iron(III) transport system permease protein